MQNEKKFYSRKDIIDKLLDEALEAQAKNVLSKVDFTDHFVENWIDNQNVYYDIIKGKNRKGDRFIIELESKYYDEANYKTFDLFLIDSSFNAEISKKRFFRKPKISLEYSRENLLIIFLQNLLRDDLELQLAEYQAQCEIEKFNNPRATARLEILKSYYDQILSKGKTK